MDDITPADPLPDFDWWGRLLVLAVLTWWTWSFATTPFGAPLGESVLHLPNLIFHEAGHLLFLPLGRFMTVLGGSLLQCAVPIALAVSFWRQENPFAALVCAWWAGQNAVDVAPYIADARALRLVLLGGRTGAEVEGHDWEFILTELGWLHLDRALGVWAYRIGLLTMLAAVAAATLLLIGRRQPRHRPRTAA